MFFLMNFYYLPIQYASKIKEYKCDREKSRGFLELQLCTPRVGVRDINTSRGQNLE